MKTSKDNSGKPDHYLDDFMALNDHVIIQNENRFVFKKGKRSSETNTSPIPITYKATLETEQVLKPTHKEKK